MTERKLKKLATVDYIILRVSSIAGVLGNSIADAKGSEGAERADRFPMQTKRYSMILIGSRRYGFQVRIDLCQRINVSSSVCMGMDRLSPTFTGAVAIRIFPPNYRRSFFGFESGKLTRGMGLERS